MEIRLRPNKLQELQHDRKLSTKRELESLVEKLAFVSRVASEAGKNFP